MTTMQDVARRAGVSKSVVSAVLNGSRHVRTSTAVRERVLRTVAEMNYVPNHAARSLRLARSGLVAAIISGMGNPVYGDMLRGIQDAAESLGYVLLLAEAQRVRPGTDLLRRLIDEGRADGFLVRSIGDLEPFSSLPRKKLPVVQLDAGPTTGQGAVRLDNEAGAVAATNHLIELGHERIGFVGGQRGYRPDTDRRRGFRAALKAAGGTYRPRWVRQDGFSPADGYRATRELLTGKNLPTAMLVSNSTTATGALAAAADAGVAVPEELSIIGFHDIAMADYVRPALTTLRMPFYELGAAGQNLLVNMIGGGKAEDILMAEPTPQVILRESTAPPP